jgi:hypothetical protein
MKATNALVTYDDLTTMGLTAKSTPPTGNHIATKSFINTYYYVNNTGAFAGYTNNQCVMYQDIVGNVPNSGTFYYTSINTSFNPVQVVGFGGDGSQACAHTTGGSITAYYYGSFGNGTELFYDTSGTRLQSDGGYFSMNGYSFLLDGDTIYSLNACSVVYYPALADLTGYGSSSDSCAFSNTNISLYATTDNPATATFYSNTSLTVLGTDTYPELADGNYHYLTLGGTAYSVTFASDSTCGNVSFC